MDFRNSPNDNIPDFLNNDDNPDNFMDVDMVAFNDIIHNGATDLNESSISEVEVGEHVHVEDDGVTDEIKYEILKGASQKNTDVLVDSRGYAYTLAKA